MPLAGRSNALRYSGFLIQYYTRSPGVLVAILSILIRISIGYQSIRLISVFVIGSGTVLVVIVVTRRHSNTLPALRCALCESVSFYKKDRQCEMCPEGRVQSVLLSVVLPALVGAFLLWFLFWAGELPHSNGLRVLEYPSRPPYFGLRCRLWPPVYLLSRSRAGAHGPCRASQSTRSYPRHRQTPTLTAAAVDDSVRVQRSRARVCSRSALSSMRSKFAVCSPKSTCPFTNPYVSSWIFAKWPS